jgi:hypothetical protein
MLKLGSWQLGLLIGLVLLGLMIMLAAMPLIERPPLEGPATSASVMGAIMTSLPPHVVLWMTFQDYIIFASLLFVLWRKEAQIYALGPIASHIFLFALLPFVPVDKVSVGFAALSHWLWAVPLYLLIRAWPQVDKKTGFGVWMTLAIAQLSISLVFDLRDGAKFLLSFL